MLACRKSIYHPVAGEIELPMLIPAFSSKGFGFHSTGKGKDKRYYSELAYALDEFSKRSMEYVLISAYDIYFDHFNAPDLQNKKTTSYLISSRVVAIDSGGYELASDFDSTEIKTFMYQPKDGFGKNEYEIVLNNLIKDRNNLHLIISNFDFESRGYSIDSQISKARNLFSHFNNCLTNFILKPWTPKSEVVDPLRMSNTDFSNLRGFDIIGVAEKDLGKNIFDRLKRVSILRKGLNEAGISSPIHIWGGLDPIMTPLFFFAGAEIFDGVSWLRYAYKNGMAINKRSYSILKPEYGVSTSHHLNEALSGIENLSFLDNLTTSLQQWIDFEGKNFDMFDPHIKESLKDAYVKLKTKINFL